ncbi:MAG: isochorismatase family protein [Lacunisphaera sp.]|nr:isochorismatase family protein [Lacunisphaera sp.]
MTTYPTTPLLLCIDLQPAFLAAIPDSQRVHRRCCFALEVAKGLGLSILFTEQVPGKLGHTSQDLLALCDEPEIVGKDTFSIFADKRIATHIKEKGLKRLLICGIETPVCVYQTARDALKAGYNVTLLSDCLGARRSGDAAAVLAQLAHDGCAVLPAETIFYSLLHHARHPFFRPYTNLVKKYG